MSNFQVKPNTFYKKNVIDLGVNVTPAFPDFSQSTETTFELSDGTPKQSAFILSGTVSSQPEYGAGELRGGLLRLYNSAIDVSYNRALPNLAAYSLDKTTAFFLNKIKPYVVATSSKCKKQLVSIFTD